MSDSNDPEIVAAAAEGAAAAVSAVQESQEQEEAVERAETAAVIAASVASETAEDAATAQDAANVAVNTAVTSQQTAEVAASVAVDAQERALTLEERVEQIDQRQTEFFEETRGFFTSLQERLAPPQSTEGEVSEVEVTSTNGGTENDGSTAGANGDTGAERQQSTRRHKFGRR